MDQYFYLLIFLLRCKFLHFVSGRKPSLVVIVLECYSYYLYLIQAVAARETLKNSKNCKNSGAQWELGVGAWDPQNYKLLLGC